MPGPSSERWLWNEATRTYEYCGENGETSQPPAPTRTVTSGFMEPFSLSSELPTEDELASPNCSTCGYTEGDCHCCGGCCHYPCTCNEDDGDGPCDDCGNYTCTCGIEAATPSPTQRATPPTTLRGYGTDASKVLGFIPPIPDAPALSAELHVAADEYKRLTASHIALAHRFSPYFGVELEVYAKHGVGPMLREFHAVMGDSIWAIFKTDSSLSDREHGVEIVTAPMTLIEHQKRWPTLQAVLRKHCIGWKMSKAGMHVHMSRGDDGYCWALSKLGLAKMSHFVHSWKNTSVLEALGGRKATSYCAFQSTRVAFKPSLGMRGERREALNLHKGPTLELRFFASTTRVERILMAVEFAACLREFVRNVSIVECADFNKFVSIAKQNAKHFPNLVSYLDYVMNKKGVLAEIEESPLTAEVKSEIKSIMEDDIKTQPLHVLVGGLHHLKYFDDYVALEFPARKVTARVKLLETTIAKKSGKPSTRRVR